MNFQMKWAADEQGLELDKTIAKKKVLLEKKESL